jgi:hypothetical protein
MFFEKNLKYPSLGTKVGVTKIRKFADDLVYLLEHHPDTTGWDRLELREMQNLIQVFKQTFTEKHFCKGPQENVMLHLPFDLEELLEEPGMEKYKSVNVNVKVNIYQEYFNSPDGFKPLIIGAHITEELLDIIFLYSTQNCTSASEYYDFIQADLVKRFEEIYGDEEDTDDDSIDARERSSYFFTESIKCLMTFLTTVAIFSNTVYTEEYLRQLLKSESKGINNDLFINFLMTNCEFYMTDLTDLAYFYQDDAFYIGENALKFKLAMYEQNPELFRLKEENQ